MIGGASSGGTFSPATALSEVWACDETDRWTPLAPFPAKVIGAQLASDGTRLVVVGGQDGDNAQFGNQSQSISDDGGATWSPLAMTALGAAGGYATAIAYDAAGSRLVAIPGSTPKPGGFIDRPDGLWQLPNGSTEWTSVCALCDQPRAAPALAANASGEVFLMNGYELNGDIAGAWVLDNGAWVQFASDPPNRNQSGAAYDAERGVIVVYGGNGASCDGDCDDTWEMTARP